MPRICPLRISTLNSWRWPHPVKSWYAEISLAPTPSTSSSRRRTASARKCSSMSWRWAGPWRQRHALRGAQLRAVGWSRLRVVTHRHTLWSTVRSAIVRGAPSLWDCCSCRWNDRAFAAQTHWQPFHQCAEVRIIWASMWCRFIQMPEEEAFCVFVKLMQDYRLRELFKPSMAELGLCMYQFEFMIQVEPPRPTPGVTVWLWWR